MIRSTFAGFNMAALSMGASQRALDVTGQNLSNINTQGYTRQRLDQVSLNPVGPSISSSQFDAKVGQGVMMTGVSQVRDPFLDVQYRTQLPKVGTADAMDAVLAEIGQIFDETDKDAIAVQFNSIVTALKNLADPENSGTDSADTVVRSAFEVLLNTVHQNGNKIQEVYDELKEKLDKDIVPDINGMLEEIVELNKAIKNTQILGNPALELQDDRNELIDALATYFPIETQYEKKYMGGGITVDVLNINLRLADGSKINLVADDQRGEVGIAKTEDGKIVEPVELFITESGENPKTYGGGDTVMLNALPSEINGYISDIVKLNESIKNNKQLITDLENQIQQAANDSAAASATAINGIVKNISDLNEQIKNARAAQNPDTKLIKQLEKDRTKAVQSLKAYFPKDAIETEVADNVTGEISVKVATTASGSYALVTPNGQIGNVSVKKDANNNVAEPAILQVVEPGGTVNGEVAAGTAVTRAMEQAQEQLKENLENVKKSTEKMEARREEKLEGLEGYFPAGTIAATENPDGVMSITAGGQDLILADNTSNTVDVTQQPDGKVTLDIAGAATAIEIPGAVVNRSKNSLNDKISEGVLKGDLDMLNKAEIFDKDIVNGTGATDTKGIQYYQGMLDTFVNQLATVMNQYNETVQEVPVVDAAGNPVMIEKEVPVMVQKMDENGNPVTDYKGDPVMTEKLDANGQVVTQTVKEQKTVKVTTQKPLFETTNDDMVPLLDADGNPVKRPKLDANGNVVQDAVGNIEEEDVMVPGNFTAQNIKISDAWMSNETKINIKREPFAEGNSSDNWNVNKMMDALSSETFEFTDPQSGKVFTGTLYECYTNIQRVQSIERKATSDILKTHTQVLDQIADSKDSVSGVWMDEEVMSLMKYSQSYNAASRLMTVMDEVIERLITQTGACGR